MSKHWIFPANLTDAKSWFMARDYFAYPLVKHIVEQERISGSANKLGPSTNLIYGFDNLVLKIFAPSICGYNALEDYNREIYILHQLQNTNILVPSVISCGCIHDRYDFYYLVLERLNIPPATHYIGSCTQRDLNYFGQELLEKIKIFNTLSIDDALAKNKTSCSPLFPERQMLLSQHRQQFVHADLSGNNILYDGKRLAIIDFEDWTYAPQSAEYPPLVFELLRGDRTLIEAFFGKPLTEEFINEIFDGIIFHYNWEQLLHQHCIRESAPFRSLHDARRSFSLWF